MEWHKEGKEGKGSKLVSHGIRGPMASGDYVFHEVVVNAE
jgi:hypothetical protein